MTPPSRPTEFFIGIMILKDGKWAPHRKYELSELGTALLDAEGLDATPRFDGIKVLKIPAATAPGAAKAEPKEMWVSPRLKARSAAQDTHRIRDGVKKTQANLAAARRAGVQKK